MPIIKENKTIVRITNLATGIVVQCWHVYFVIVRAIVTARNIVLKNIENY